MVRSLAVTVRKVYTRVQSPPPGERSPMRAQVSVDLSKISTAQLLPGPVTTNAESSTARLCGGWAQSSRGFSGNTKQNRVQVGFVGFVVTKPTSTSRGRFAGGKFLPRNQRMLPWPRPTLLATHGDTPYLLRFGRNPRAESVSLHSGPARHKRIIPYRMRGQRNDL